MTEVFIVDGVRTPIGKFRGSLSEVRADDLAAMTIKALLKKLPALDPTLVDDVILGCHNQAGEDNRNVARMALLLAGLPASVPGETVNRLCASGMSAVIQAYRAIKSGDGHLFIAGGVEHMTRSPYVMSKSSGAFGNDAKLYDSSFGWRFINPAMKQMYGTEAMGETAENLVEFHKISREDQDKFALQSQLKAARATQSKRLGKEIFSVEIPQAKGSPFLFENDEFIKADSTLEKLAKLKPAFRDNGTVTAGNSSGLNDGACTLLIASAAAVKKYSLKPIARIVSSQVIGVEPRIMGIGPVEASNKALAKAGLSMKDMGVIELNEAFAAQSLACIRSWGLSDDDERINPNGGAIALGHPLGMSGARLLLTAGIELQQRQGKYALCTMCVGVGQGYATIIERV
jgi:acetyl-CoA acyltransferase